jgi:hypothetical protein
MLPAVQNFFQLIKNSKLKEAYDSTSDEFKAGGSFDEFQQFLKEMGLMNFKNAVWSGFDQDQNMAAIKGVVSNMANQDIPVIVYCISDGQSWKVHNITPANPVHSDSIADVPDPSVLSGLIHHSMTLFILALQHKDFSDFYQNIAALWKVETDPEKLQAVFADFMEKNLDLSFVSTTNPVLSAKPVINDQGFLEVKGYYPSAERHLTFELMYTYEHPEWKLLSIQVSSIKV